MQLSHNNIIPVINMITMKEIWVRTWDESNNAQGNDYVYKVKIHLMKDSSNISADNNYVTSLLSSMKNYVLKFEHIGIDECNNNNLDSMEDDEYGFLS